MTLLNILKDIRKGVREGTLDESVGICVLIHLQDPGYQGTLRAVFRLWPHFSGHPSYPVPSCDSSLSPVSAYLDAHRSGRVWSGEYGELRKDLLNFLIDYFDAENWQPIETARNGERVLLFAGSVTIGSRRTGGPYEPFPGKLRWRDDDGDVIPGPSHWIHLPEAPLSEQDIKPATVI